MKEGSSMYCRVLWPFFERVVNATDLSYIIRPWTLYRKKRNIAKLESNVIRGSKQNVKEKRGRWQAPLHCYVLRRGGSGSQLSKLVLWLCTSYSSEAHPQAVTMSPSLCGSIWDECTRACRCQNIIFLHFWYFGQVGPVPKPSPCPDTKFPA